MGAVSGLVLHHTFVAALGITPPADSAEDAELRTIPAMLGKILSREPARLDVPRPPERRLIAICRDYALVACAALRHHGVLGGDYWGITRSISFPGAPVSEATAARIDAIAEATREAYERDDVRVPPVVLSCRRTGPVDVPVPA